MNYTQLILFFFRSLVNLQSPELEYRHELVGRPNKIDSDIKVEIIPTRGGQQLIPTVISATSPRSGHSAASSTTTIYLDSYGNECNFSKTLSSYPDADSTNPYNLLAKYSPDANAKVHKEYVCMSSAAADESYMRPPLWEDITSSIQNIDPENAIMLGGAVATHVKLEANDSEQYIEDLSTAAQPLLSPLEIKHELKQHPHSHHHHHHHHHHPSSNNQLYISTPPNSSHPHPHSHSHGNHQQQQNHNPNHLNQTLQSSHSIYLNGIISNSSISAGR